MLKAFAFAAVAAILATPAAYAFGTTHSQGDEHERISRNALACGNLTTTTCWQPKTMSEFAGSTGDFGAIGVPDSGTMVFESKAHCDNGDYLAVPGYPQSQKQARQALWNCREWIFSKFNEAVNDAGALLDSQGKLRSNQLSYHCVFKFQVKGDAKCNVLEDLGIMMHASQDFYSHTNFTDHAAPGATSLTNPPGLGQARTARFISIDENEGGIPADLISGCFKALPESWYCSNRVRHADLNKDEGAINGNAIGAAATPRGKVDDNFRNAVTYAIADSRQKWGEFEHHLRSKYGDARGALMACAISHDDPMKTCK